MDEKTVERTVAHTVDFCVVGGGLAGMLAAVAAARRGLKVLLMQDRPVLGGNCSSEIRMWALGCHGENHRETGILEEILLENMARNPTRNFSLWDSVLYETVKNEPGITLLLNCSCTGLTMEGDRIAAVRGWQLTAYTWHLVRAAYFADCSGDSVLAEPSGAWFRMGREASDEYGESIAPAVADEKTMGLSCLLQARETNAPVPFTPPAWAYSYETEEAFPFRAHDLHDPTFNFWWMELGGEAHTIHDTEAIRDELLKIAFGVWDHIKNHGDHGADNWELDWVGFLPGKRESRRYIGDHVLTQNDVEAGGRFADIVGYGGWSMDDHHPAGFHTGEPPTIYHPAPAPYGIPYRCLYSKNVENLFVAGRNISATHAAMSSSRVMATCAVLGQAVGTACAIAARDGLSPREVYECRIDALQQALMEDDCYLPGQCLRPRPWCAAASLSGCENAENLRSGVHRPVDGEDNGCFIPLGQAVVYELAEPRRVEEVHLVFDSDLNRLSCSGHPVLRAYPTLCNRPAGLEPFGFPTTMTRAFRVEYRDGAGAWRILYETADNHQRLARLPAGVETAAVRFIPLATWGDDGAHVFAFTLR